MNDTELDQLLDTWQSPAPSPSLRRTTLAALPPRPPRRVFGLPLRWVVAAALSAGGFAIGTSIWNSPEIGRFYGQSGNIHMHSTRLVDPPTAVIRWWSKGAGNSIGETASGGIRGSGYLRDRSAGKFYGYSYVGEPVGGGMYQITFAPFDPATLRKGPFKMEGEVVQGAPLHAPVMIHDGDTFDVDLYSDGASRVFDRIQISTHPFPEEPKRAPSREQQDWEAVKMTLGQPRVFVDAVFAGEDRSTAAGACVWVPLSDHAQCGAQPPLRADRPRQFEHARIRQQQQAFPHRNGDADRDRSRPTGLRLPSAELRRRDQLGLPRREAHDDGQRGTGVDAEVGVSSPWASRHDRQR
jgi:hypothetical protein